MEIGQPGVVSSSEYFPLLIATPKKAKKSSRKVLFMGVPQERKPKKKKSVHEQSSDETTKQKTQLRKAIYLDEIKCAERLQKKSHNENVQKSLVSFLNSHSDRAPLAFDIIQRGQIPGIKFTSILI